MNIHYRKLTVDDLEMVLQMNRDFRSFIVRANALHFLRDGRNWLYGAVSGNTVIGFAYGYELSRLNDIGNMLYIHEVGVMDSFQRQGVGTALLTHLKDECRKRKICRFFLSCYQNNAAANALYRKIGGKVSPESDGNDCVYFFVPD